MVRNVSCCCWLRCLLTVLLQTIDKHKRKINSTPTTRAILYPNVLICFKGLREERWSATVSRKSDPEITSRCLLKSFSMSCCRSWISTEILPRFNRCHLTLSQLNCVSLYLKAVTQKEVKFQSHLGLTRLCKLTNGSPNKITDCWRSALGRPTFHQFFERCKGHRHLYAILVQNELFV